MTFLSKIKERIAVASSAFWQRRHLDRIDRSDVLLAHHVIARRRFPTFKQWQLIGRVLKNNERKLLRLGSYAMVFGALLIGARWMFIHAVFVPSAGGEYREGIVGSPRNINPILAGGNDVDQDIVKLVFNGLYTRSTNGKFVLDIAEKVEISPDGKKYTFTLKSNIYFHDGYLLTSNDVVFTFGAISNPAWKSPLTASLSGITASAPDDKTVVLDLIKPYSYLPSTLTFGILPKHVWESLTPGSLNLTDFNLKPIGTGPYQFEKFTRNSEGDILSYSLVSTKIGNGQIERITFKFFDDYDTAIDKLSSNAVDGLNFINPSRRNSIKTIPGLTIRTPAISQYTAIFLNPKNNPILSDPKIRQALAYAIDRKKILTDALSDSGLLRDTLFNENDLGNNLGITKYQYNPAMGAKLLDEAGYVISPESGIRTKSTTKPATKKDPAVTETKELSISLTTIDTDSNLAVAEIIRENWAALGVKVEVVAASAKDIQKSIIVPREYDAIIFGEILGTDSDPYPFWHSSQIENGLNLSAYSNRRADELLEKARLAENEEKRDTLLSEFQNIITKDVPAIFLYQPVYFYPQSDNIRGFSVQTITTPADRFANITAWYRKFKLSFK